MIRLIFKNILARENRAVRCLDIVNNPVLWYQIINSIPDEEYVVKYSCQHPPDEDQRTVIVYKNGTTLKLCDRKLSLARYLVRNHHKKWFKFMGL